MVIMHVIAVDTTSPRIENEDTAALPVTFPVTDFVFLSSRECGVRPPALSGRHSKVYEAQWLSLRLCWVGL
jgi:hypothetical protein